MKTNSVLRTMSANDEALACKLEFVILSLLIHYNGYYQDSLVEWYSALRLGVPQLTDIQQLGDVFSHLSAGGIIELDLPIAGPSRSDGDRKPFMTTLTPAGLIHWNSVRVRR